MDEDRRKINETSEFDFSEFIEMIIEQVEKIIAETSPNFDETDLKEAGVCESDRNCINENIPCKNGTKPLDLSSARDKVSNSTVSTNFLFPNPHSEKTILNSESADAAIRNTSRNYKRSVTFHPLSSSFENKFIPVFLSKNCVWAKADFEETEDFHEVRAEVWKLSRDENLKEYEELMVMSNPDIYERWREVILNKKLLNLQDEKISLKKEISDLQAMLDTCRKRSLSFLGEKSDNKT